MVYFHIKINIRMERILVLVHIYQKFFAEGHMVIFSFELYINVDVLFILGNSLFLSSITLNKSQHFLLSIWSLNWITCLLDLIKNQHQLILTS